MLERVFFIFVSFHFLVFLFIFIFRARVERSKSTAAATAAAAAAGQQRENSSRWNIIIHDGHQPEKPVHKTRNGHTSILAIITPNTQIDDGDHHLDDDGRAKKERKDGNRSSGSVAKNEKEKKNHQRQHRAK